MIVLALLLVTAIELAATRLIFAGRMMITVNADSPDVSALCLYPSQLKHAAQHAQI